MSKNITSLTSMPTVYVQLTKQIKYNKKVLHLQS